MGNQAGKRALVNRALLVAVVAATVVTVVACDSNSKVGEVKNPVIAINRDGAASAVIGGKVQWVFGDTIAPGGVARNSLATADPSKPEVVSDTLASGNAPYQVVPFTAAESQDNAAAAGKGQWVIWPTSIIATGSNTGLVFSTKFYATDSGWTSSSLVVSKLQTGQTQSTRLAEPLTTPEANFAMAPFEHEGFVYLMDCGGLNIPHQAAVRVMPGLASTADITGFNGTGKCRLARVPVEKAADRSAYTFWTGVAWLPTSLTATPVVPGTGAGLSVAWDPYFGKFVALSVPGISNEIQMSTAPSLTGPWTTPETIYTTETNTYAVRVHPELSSSDMSTMAVTYYRQDTPEEPGAVMLVHLKLDKR